MKQVKSIIFYGRKLYEIQLSVFINYFVIPPYPYFSILSMAASTFGRVMYWQRRYGSQNWKYLLFVPLGKGLLTPGIGVSISIEIVVCLFQLFGFIFPELKYKPPKGRDHPYISFVFTFQAWNTAWNTWQMLKQYLLGG